MSLRTIERAFFAAFLVSILSACASKTPSGPALTETEVTQIGADVYIYGYPLVTLEMTRRLTTNTVEPVGLRAPMGQFAHLRAFPPITYRDIPGANADTLYSAAWLDLGNEPYVLSIPDADGRYFMMPMLDGWAEVFEAPGTRTTGGRAQTYAITGPHWKGHLPDGMTEYKSATDMVWVIGRTYTTGTAQDYDKVHAFQDKLSLRPLSAYGKNYSPAKGEVRRRRRHEDADQNPSSLDGRRNLLQASRKAHERQPADARRRCDGCRDGEDWVSSPARTGTSARSIPALPLDSPKPRKPLLPEFRFRVRDQAKT